MANEHRNGTHQVLAYADDVNLIGDNIEQQKDMQMFYQLAVNKRKNK